MCQDPVRYTVTPGALPTLIPLMASRTSEGMVNVGALAGSHRLMNHLSNCRVRRVVHLLKLSLKVVGQSFRLHCVSRNLVVPSLAREAKEWEFASRTSKFYQIVCQIMLGRLRRGMSRITSRIQIRISRCCDVTNDEMWGTIQGAVLAF
jgi:hypothetical protein